MRDQVATSFAPDGGEGRVVFSEPLEAKAMHSQVALTPPLLRLASNFSLLPLRNKT